MRSLLSLLSSLLLVAAAIASPLEVRQAGNASEQVAPSKWYNDKTKDFWVNGTAIPEVAFDVGESYAGLLSISDDPNDDRKLYFWFFPSSNPNATNEVGLWFNGGPGCSSLSGLLTENGPFLWQEGTYAPVQNPYTWSNLTNYIWIEQPVGVGYTTGVPSITDEVGLGLQFIGFWKNFVDTFDMHGFDVYLTGESYAGFYVPYIADAFITANDTAYYNLKGIAINDPIIGDETAQSQVVVGPYLAEYQNIIFLNQTFLEAFSELSDSCGYTSYFEKYLQYPPPPGPFPVLPDPYVTGNYTCDTFDIAYAAILEVNPCFNIYHITDQCPFVFSQLGSVNTGDYVPPGAQVYFNRTDVQAAINAPVGTNWMQCTDVNVFANKSTRSTDNSYDGGYDRSLGPAQNNVLQRVIEYTNNVVIGSGNLDFLLPTNGTLLAIQNMTWNGAQGLQSFPGEDFLVPYHPEYNSGALAGAGVLGYWGKERGLTFYQVQLAGHELPGYTAGAGYRSLEYLLGRIDSLGDPGSFTTLPGDWSTGELTLVAQRDRDARRQRLLSARLGGRAGGQRVGRKGVPRR